MLFKKLKLRLAYHNEKKALKHFDKKELKKMLDFYKRSGKNLEKCERAREKLAQKMSETLKKFRKENEKLGLEIYSKKLCAKMARNIQKRISRF